jgi:Mrp family chromosome partitioning ATPase
VERFDRIIIDSPVYLGIADSSLLAAISDGVIMVVRSGMTSMDKVRWTSKNLKSINAKILGAVLNDQARKSVEYYHTQNYSYYYSDKKYLPAGLLLLDDKRGGKH